MTHYTGDHSHPISHFVPNPAPGDTFLDTTTGNKFDYKVDVSLTGEFISSGWWTHEVKDMHTHIFHRSD